MSLQAIRRVYEDHVRTAAALLNPPVPVFVDNQPFTDSDTEAEHIRMRLDFGVGSEEVLGDLIENIRGTFVVEVYTPKNKGPGRCQTIATEILKSMNGINRTRYQGINGVRASIRPMSGPNFYTLEGRPHFYARMGCSFQASYTGP